MLEEKPKQVVLWGVGDFAQCYLDYLKEAGIAVAFCVDLYYMPLGGSFSGYTVLSPQEYDAMPCSSGSCLAHLAAACQW